MQGFWDLQRRVPVVHLYGTVILCPNEFLVKKIPQIGKLMDKKAMDYNTARKEYLARRDASIAR